MSTSRRTVLKATVAGAALGGIGAPFMASAQSAEFTYKDANNLPDSHPLNVRAKEMAVAIKAETSGKFDLQIFPNNQLGSDAEPDPFRRRRVLHAVGPDPGDPGAASGA